MSDIIEKQLSYLINGCIFDVHNEVGPGLREECYQKAMEYRFVQKGIPFVAKPATRRDLIYLGEVASTFEPDLVVSNRVIVELKTHPEGMPVACFRQTINYLKFWGYELGLLVNFADARADIRRVVFHEVAVEPNEDFDAIRDAMSDDARDRLLVVRDAILTVHTEFGLGYSDRTYHNLLDIGFKDRGLLCQSDIVAEPVFQERRLPSSPISPLLVANSILVQVEAIQDGVTARAVRTMQTHLKCLNASVGVIASFGQSRFEVRGVRPLRR